MNIQDLTKQYAKLPQAAALAKALGNVRERNIFLEGLLASAAPVLFGSVAGKCKQTVLFILQDTDEAGYFYHDLTQLLGTRQVLFFPSGYRRAAKYAQRDAANEILRTETLAALSAISGDDRGRKKASSDPQPPRSALPLGSSKNLGGLITQRFLQVIH